MLISLVKPKVTSGTPPNAKVPEHAYYGLHPKLKARTAASNISVVGGQCDGQNVVTMCVLTEK